MRSYLNNSELKTKAIQKLKDCMAQNKLIPQGFEYWEEGKGNVMGCISEENDRETIANMFGFPEQLIEIQNHIFRNLPYEQAKQFGLDFLENVPVGVDLASVWKKYFIWLLVEVDNSIMDVLQHIDLAKETIEKAVETLRRSLTQEIAEKEVAGIAQNLNMNVRNIGIAADAGAIEPEMAGLILATAYAAVIAHIHPNFADYVLPQQGPVEMWNLLADKLIHLLQETLLQ